MRTLREVQADYYDLVPYDDFREVQLALADLRAEADQFGFQFHKDFGKRPPRRPRFQQHFRREAA